MRKIYIGLGTFFVALGFSCTLPVSGGKKIINEAPLYGLPPPNGNVTIQGVVKSGATGEPVPGIAVAVEQTTIQQYTDDAGRFWFYVPEEGVYTLSFDDIDGTENGAFLSKKEAVDLTGQSTVQGGSGVMDLEIKLEDAAE
ncbi:hypothetical protein FACS1894124_0600 [Spirochaetia bacterium]|nr:hypothetical protein FACS1894124_0600 [Spirochaetia bacterium]